MIKKLAKPLQCKKMVPAAVILPLPSDEVVSRKPPVLFEAPGAMFPRVEDRGIRVRGKYSAWVQPYMCRRGRPLFYDVQHHCATVAWMHKRKKPIVWVGSFLGGWVHDCC